MIAKTEQMQVRCPSEGDCRDERREQSRIASGPIILNTKCSKEKIPEELEAFYAFVDSGRVDENDMLVKYLDERVEEANNDEEVDRIMTLEEEMIIRYDRGLRKGKDQGSVVQGNVVQPKM